jgi:hypothetical protein
LSLTILAGTSGFPGDGETPPTPTAGLWGYFLYPPSGTVNNYGALGGIYHWGFWIYIPIGTVLGTTSITDGALKFMRHGYDTIAQKLDVHTCNNFQGYAYLNEFDPNLSTNNNYPSSRSPTNNPMNATMPIGQWAWIENAVYLHTDGNQAWQRTWVNDILVLQRTGLTIKWRDTGGTYHTYNITGTTGAPTLPSAGATLQYMYFLTYWNAHPSVNTTIYVDDIMTAITETGMIYTDNLGNPIMGSASS